VGPRAILDAVVKRKIPSPRRESKPRTPIVQPVGSVGVHRNNITSSDLGFSLIYLKLLMFIVSHSEPFFHMPDVVHHLYPNLFSLFNYIL
jgi:hypothetical protein